MLQGIVLFRYTFPYHFSRDYTCFDELNQVIIDVALVRPKGDIFVSSIKHLLVIVNAAEIVLLGVTLNSETGTGGDLVLHKTGLGFPSDEVNMLSVIGTRSGRIFAGGQDGNLYEFIYQAEEGWFTRKCRKVNKTSSPMSYFTPTFLKMSQSSSAIVSLTYDNGRNLLYALGDDSTIQVFYLGTRDNSFDKIFHASDLYDRASSLCPTGVLNKKGFKVVSISAVEAADSAFIHLIAMTSCGVKLYFTTLKRDERAYSRNQLLSSPPTPSTFEMVHVRLPPEDGRLRESRRLLTTCSPNVHTSFTKNGVTLCANAISDQEDLLIGTILNQAVATSPGRHGPLECISDVHVEGKIWEIAKVHCESPPDIVGKRISASFMESISPLPSDAGKYLILTNAGVFSLTKTTPVEELQKILIDSNGNMENPLLKQYFDAYSADQGCFLCIVLACTVQNAWKSFASTSTSRSILDSKTCANLSLWAVNAMIRFGGEPRIIETSIPGIDYIGLPSSSILNVPAFGSRIEYEFSDLHRGLYLYFSRLVVSFWNKPLISFTEPNSEVMMALHSYCEFLERNPGLSSRTFLTSASPNMGNISKETRQKLEESHHAENESIRTLIWLARATLELLAFLSICKDYHILDTSLRDNGDGEKLEFEDLLATPRGRELVSDIASALVQKQLKMRSSIDSLCQILLQRCPNFFGESEIMTFQGTECLERAFLTRDTSERNLQLQESLTMFLKGSSTMSFSTLSDVARRYQSLAFFPGLIELCLYSAQIRDPENIALSAFRTSNIQLTTQQQEIINLREGIYSFVFEALRAVHGLEARTISSVIGPIGKILVCIRFIHPLHRCR